ncbi:uncharacterized protein LOC106655772 [Trichogramma pretiosum]|uniref:uncharacterized protein LOC106655772 n=1 Tax=Trichogramma pretiosum TaxID=7493 RepID=UPI0006C9C368|nr:uncharacterized protein LOC106655772 [Trichogramma pretiosum]
MRLPDFREKYDNNNNDATTSTKMERIKGDGLNIKMAINSNNLYVRGDGCRVELRTNQGRLRVTGDGCSVHVDRNLGSVEYRGDGGCITFGSESNDNVVYKGSGGLITFPSGHHRDHNRRHRPSEKRIQAVKTKTTTTTKQCIVESASYRVKTLVTNCTNIMCGVSITTR